MLRVLGLRAVGYLGLGSKVTGFRAFGLAYQT